ncbi:MAG TPA: hypothetical protein VNO82_13410 [Solirubrobacteraceae bacterium]|nr:hypothetical protein [Solirubrobacteraceae bacterium]
MVSSTLNRSAATLGVVVAGLLAAAGPASAQLPPTTNGVTAPASPTAEAQLLFKGEMVGLEPAMSAGISGQEMSAAVKAPKPPASSEEPTESASFNYLKAAGTETGNPERKGSLTASGGWDPTHALNSQGIALHAVATAVVGGLVPGGAIVSA